MAFRLRSMLDLLADFESECPRAVCSGVSFSLTVASGVLADVMFVVDPERVSGAGVAIQALIQSLMAVPPPSHRGRHRRPLRAAPTGVRALRPPPPARDQARALPCSWSTHHFLCLPSTSDRCQSSFRPSQNEIGVYTRNYYATVTPVAAAPVSTTATSQPPQHGRPPPHTLRQLSRPRPTSVISGICRLQSLFYSFRLSSGPA